MKLKLDRFNNMSHGAVWLSKSIVYNGNRAVDLEVTASGKRRKENADYFINWMSADKRVHVDSTKL